MTRESQYIRQENIKDGAQILNKNERKNKNIYVHVTSDRHYSGYLLERVSANRSVFLTTVPKIYCFTETSYIIYNVGQKHYLSNKSEYASTLSLKALTNKLRN